MNVLIVDDDAFTLDVLQHTIEKLGHTAVRASNGQEALDTLRREDLRLVVTDWDMPGMNGVAFCRAIRSDELNGYVYVIMLTGRDDTKSRREGLSAGADDFLFKPLDADDLMVCFKTAERILSLEIRDVALFALAKLAESRDPDTGAHVERVQSYSRLLAHNLSPAVKELHGINPEFIRLLYQTSALHDLGKVGISDSILLKPGKLTPDEFEIMKTHALLGAQTLDAALERFPGAKFLRMARDIAISHHERFDGSGYPSALAGEQIPFCARVVALADVYDALTSRRVYKEAMPHEQARQFILSGRGRSFDPDVVESFIRSQDKFLAVRSEMIEPIAVPKAAPPPSAGRAPVCKENPCSILIVEDSTTTLHSLTDLLATTGHRVLAAGNIQDGMRLFSENSPEIVISDWEMPGGSGVDFCRKVRSGAAGRPVHFIMLTAHSDQAIVLEAYAAGVNDFVAKPFSPPELLARVNAGIRVSELHQELARRSDRLIAMNAELKLTNSRLDRLSVTDELTGLFNRRHAMVRLNEQWALADRHSQSLSIAVVDIDYFKKINDTCGHEAGDAVLRQVAGILRECARGTDIVCRVGGEEFLLIFPSQNTDGAQICAERCRAAVQHNSFRIGDRDLKVTISIGIATKHHALRQFSELLRAADEALYAAKNAGRNRVLTYQEIQMDSQAKILPDASSPPSSAAERSESAIDVSVITDRCGGDTEFAASIIERFRTQAPAEVAKIDAALLAKDAACFRRAAHTVKSMSAYVTADVAAGLCKQLEELGAADRLSDAEGLLQTLHAEVERITTWIAERTPCSSPSSLDRISDRC